MSTQSSTEFWSCEKDLRGGACVVTAPESHYTGDADDNAGDIKISVGAAQGRNSLATVSVKDLNAKALTVFDATLDFVTKAPILYFAANRDDDITSPDPSENLDAVTSQHDLFFAITAQILRK